MNPMKVIGYVNLARFVAVVAGGILLIAGKWLHADLAPQGFSHTLEVEHFPQNDPGYKDQDSTKQEEARQEAKDRNEPVYYIDKEGNQQIVYPDGSVAA